MSQKIEIDNEYLDRLAGYFNELPDGSEIIISCIAENPDKFIEATNQLQQTWNFWFITLSDDLKKVKKCSFTTEIINRKFNQHDKEKEEFA